jgi:anti-sigma28 factor (negative regulator of flagellin synthesis)
MSINPLGLSALFGQAQAVKPSAAALPMGEVSTTKKTPAEEAMARVEARAEAQKASSLQVLDQIKEKGFYAWAQEQKVEKLKERIREQVMAENGLDEASLAAMEPEARTKAEATIEEEISRLVKQAMEDAMQGKMAKAEDEQKPTTAMIIDISV